MSEHMEAVTFWRTTTFAAVVFFLLSAAAGSILAATWAQQYEDRVGPRVRVGSVEVGGLTREEALERLQRATDERLSRGVEVELNGRAAAIPLITLRSGDTTEDVSFDEDAAVAEALARGRSPNPALDALSLLRLKFVGDGERVDIPVSVTRENVEANVRAAFPDLETPTQETAFAFKKTRGGWTGEVVEGKVGRLFDFDAFAPRLTRSLQSLESSTVRLTMTSARPDVDVEAARFLLSEGIEALENAPVLIAERPDGSGSSWSVGADALARMLVAQSRDGRVVLTVKADAFDALLDDTASALERPAQNARFQVVDGKVTEFATSSTGVALDRAATRNAFEDALSATPAVAVVVLEETAPEVSTDEGNDLGITEALGTGTSSFKGSPGNRIKNIRNGVRLLNGILIAPDETFSLTDALKPFTLENGYLPELVIKGDKIEPELGGGLCQIGTTTFRAAMNSGLPIAERRNHSLVVSYYNDPGNGNPGTDATIYEPAPDLKFVNDTGHYILFQAQMNEASQSLAFTFWGTSDGREGSYTPPKVIRWIPYGEDVRTETADLAAGVEKCQAPHIGADTTFTYAITRADGSTEETVFDSHYRPLPRLCLIGKATAEVIPIESLDTGGTVSEPVTTP